MKLAAHVEQLLFDGQHLFPVSQTRCAGEPAKHCTRNSLAYSQQYNVQLFAKILHNGSESGSVTLANQIHFSSRVQLQLVTPTCV